MNSNCKDPVSGVNFQAWQPPGDLIALASGEAHLWYAWTEKCCTPRRLARYRSLLSEQEHQRLECFRFDHIKREYLLTRALCRFTLSRYANVSPSAWQFRTNEFGRPEIASPDAPPSLRFNLANATSLVACLVAFDIDAGVDVEETNREGEVTDLVDRYFSQSEVRALRALPLPEQRRRFFQLWTLKESYIKARGMGLSIPLEQFSFELDEPPPIRISFDPVLEDVATDWQFQTFAPSVDLLMAVGLRRGNVPDLRISVAETIPGVVVDRFQNDKDIAY
ncbi:4'-phosphopantetheinyl transferase superfamily protein [Rhodanobacter sp. MP1X3]|uniref:4'-phosphopantetheinyl transferase family protein n=1 Tax=Rhodanobacter sp. MP1X3 TaxID=2723086 RepID=UPI001606F990|nr:4'-phosphopantetheinyl transferase superfamily protein [Rhodanobacter sp. MP1X3]MBB6243709.1 4'-phosphopantetheinyl transferase [Rhodanobacter sp. MP1X3]